MSDSNTPVMDQDSFIAEMHAQFLSDPEDHLAGMREDLERLNADPRESLTSFMRHCHSLKGGAQMVGLVGVGELLHDMETQAAGVRDREIPGEHMSHTYDLLRSCFVELETYIQVLKGAKPGVDPYRDKWTPTLGAMAVWLKDYPTREGPNAPEISAEPVAKADDPWGLKEMEEGEVEKPVAPPIVEASGFGFFDDVPDAPASPPVAPQAPAPADISGFGFFEDEPPATESTPAAAPVAPARVGATVKREAESIEYLLCENDGQHYAVPVGLVREVIAAIPLSEVPRAPDAVDGIIRLRDEFIPVVKRAVIFGERHATARENVRECIIVCEMGSRKFGIQVEKVHQVLACRGDSLQKLNNAAGARGGLIADIGTIEGNSVLFIDLAGIELS